MVDPSRSVDSDNTDGDTTDQLGVPELDIEEQELMCGNVPYDIERTIGQILFLSGTPEEGPLIQMPPFGWKLVDPDVPIDAEWHAHVVNWMAEHRDPTMPDHATYLARLAIFVYCFYTSASSSPSEHWPELVRKGTAWALMRNGLRQHNFVIRNWPLSRTIVSPDENFFENNVSKPEILADLLQRIYHFDPPSNQQG